jgi:hypothetical protein
MKVRGSRTGLIVGLPLLVFLLITFVIVRDVQTPITPGGAAPLTQTFDQSTAFTLKYPDGWEYTIPIAGVFLLAPSETLYNNQPGPTLTVQRTAPLSVSGTLENALIEYLNGGPLRTPGQWRVTDPIHAIEFHGRDARMVEVEGANSSASPTMHSRIIVTAADNSFVYLFISLMPLTKVDVSLPTLDAMLATVQILE